MYFTKYMYSNNKKSQYSNYSRSFPCKLKTIKLNMSQKYSTAMFSFSWPSSSIWTKTQWWYTCDKPVMSFTFIKLIRMYMQLEIMTQCTDGMSMTKNWWCINGKTKINAYPVNNYCNIQIRLSNLRTVT